MGISKNVWRNWRILRILNAQFIEGKFGHVNYYIASKFDRHIGSSAAKVPVKFQSDRTILNTNLAASGLHNIFKCIFLNENVWNFN